MGNENTNNFFLAERRRNVNEQQQQKLDEILKKHEYKSNLVIAIMRTFRKSITIFRKRHYVILPKS